MDIKENNLDQVDRDKWDELVDLSPDSTPFCRWEWLELLEQGFSGWHVHCLVAEAEGRYAAGMPLVIATAPGLRQSHSMSHGAPAGPILTPGEDPKLAGRLLAWWADRRSAGWRGIRLSVTFDSETPPGMNVLHSREFAVEQQTTYRINLSGRTFEDWERSLSQQTRNKNRQALERGGTFAIVDSSDMAGELSRLAGLTANRHQRDTIPFGKKFYKTLLSQQEQQGTGMVRVVAVRVDGRTAAYNLCVVHRGRMWLIDHGADSSLFDTRPNNLIYREIIKWAFTEDLDEVDLGAVPPDNESLARFKMGLDGQPHGRTSAIKTNLPFRVARAAGSMLRRSRK